MKILGDGRFPPFRRNGSYTNIWDTSHVDEQMEFFTSKHKLSKRESEVLKLVVLGKNNQEIAKELFLALGTVKTHVHNIMVKTGCADRASLTKAFWNN